MQIVDRGNVFCSKKGTDAQSCAFPQICVLPSGRWICAFRTAPTKTATAGQRPMITWSDNEGASWSEPAEPFVPPLVNDRPGLFRGAALTSLEAGRVLAVLCWVEHSDPSLPFFNEETQGLLDTRIFFSTSEEQGTNWTPPKLMDTSPFNVPTPITGPVLIMPDSRLACQFELNKHYYDTVVWRHKSVMMFSRDNGKSWAEYVITSSDPENRIFYWDQRPGVLADGRILDLFWSYDNHKCVYLNIHARESIDNGCNWSEMWDTGVEGQPAPPVSLPDGAVAMAYVDRKETPAIKMRTSPDDGRSWPKETEMVLCEVLAPSQTSSKSSMQDAWTEMSAFSIGLPATAQLANGDILVVYYAGLNMDLTDICWVRIQS